MPPRELFDLQGDPGERNNLADLPPHAKTQAELRRRLQAFFERYAEPKYDLWRGGKSKHDSEPPSPQQPD
jgi:hypothetical protein